MIRFYGEELLVPRPNLKLEDHPLLGVRDCLFNVFAATFHIGGRSSIRNLRTRNAVVTGTHLPRIYTHTCIYKLEDVIFDCVCSFLCCKYVVLLSYPWYFLCPKSGDSSLFET